VGLAARRSASPEKCVIDISNAENRRTNWCSSIRGFCAWKAAGRRRRMPEYSGFREQVKRGKRATVHAQNAKGEPFEMTGEDLLARAILHETDHFTASCISATSAPEARPDPAQSA